MPTIRPAVPADAGEATSTVLVAYDGARMVGSGRARLAGGEWHIGRLVVAPDRQGGGVGTMLLDAIEDAAPATSSSCTIETGPSERRLRSELEAQRRRSHTASAARSPDERNVRLYERRGYHQVPNDSILVRLTRPREQA